MALIEKKKIFFYFLRLEKSFLYDIFIYMNLRGGI